MATQTALSLADKARILRENGIRVCQWFEPEDPPHFPMPILYFLGDEQEGERAVRIAQENGVAVFLLARQWDYNGCDEPQSVAWSMVF